MLYNCHFTKDWTQDELEQIALDISTDPKLHWQGITGLSGFLFRRAKYTVDGFRRGMWIRVVIEPEGRGILAAFPLDERDREQYSS